MWFVAETNFIALLIGLLIGLVTAFWIFKGRRGRVRTVEDTTSESHAQETPLP